MRKLSVSSTIGALTVRSTRAAYKKADGIKIDGRRVVVDYERGRTQKNWLPRRLGGGKGDSRKTREPRAAIEAREGANGNGYSGGGHRDHHGGDRDRGHRGGDHGGPRFGGGHGGSGYSSRDDRRDRDFDSSRSSRDSRDSRYRDDRHGGSRDAGNRDGGHRDGDRYGSRGGERDHRNGGGHRDRSDRSRDYDRSRK
ncbi:hypothetical protein L596_023283 [Steinernema carpocapsae]|uniref:Uncharacterized protein n=1 Tax=Steinernema carpocapsae TaxID=34508 RepID=A0A4U5MD58_STECR|nr:hypothetical protein L596_023283 [Steinernema carpocapsae]